MTLGDALRSGRGSNLDVLRLILAVAVIISHAWPLALGPDTAEPLEELTGRSLGGWAVGLFFFISGLLITGSAERSGKKRFWIARARRILPGLTVALLVTLALALASGSTAGFPETLAWFARALTLFSIEHRLTDAFESNPIPEVVNGPLWSLFHEVTAYCICAGFVWIVGTRRKGAVIILLALAVTGAVLQDALPGRVATFAPLFAAFVFGMFCYLYKEQIQLNALVVFLCVFLAVLMPWELAIGPVGLIVVALVMSAPAVKLGHDTSYGFYIYGWPVSQTIVHLSPGVSPMELGFLTVVCTLPLAFLSWHLVERPSLVARRISV